MSRRGSWLPALLVLLAAAPPAAASEPRLALDPAGRLLLSRLPPLLAEAEVRRHLDSGLTTSLVLQGDPAGAEGGGAARVDVRLELWDEVYLVTLVDGAGEIRRTRQPSFERLAEWWSELEVVLRPASEVAAAAARQARVSLAVVPFSQAELLDTQRWLVESIGQAQGGSRAARDGGATDAVQALIATSMQRRAVRTMVWEVTIERRAQP